MMGEGGKWNWWDIVKPFLFLEHLESGDLEDYLEPVKQSLRAINQLVGELVK